MLKVIGLASFLAATSASASVSTYSQTQDLGQGLYLQYEQTVDSANGHAVTLADLLSVQRILNSSPNFITDIQIYHQDFAAQNGIYSLGEAVYSVAGVQNPITNSSTGGWWKRFLGNGSSTEWTSEVATGGESSLPLDAGCAPLALGLAVFALKKRIFA